jgi:2-aminoadipate transaminase
VETISFAGEGLCPELVPADELADCAGAVLEDDGARILSYGPGGGYAPLREHIGERFGVPPHRVILTNGWLHGLELLTRVAFRQSALVEYPTYVRVLRFLFAAGVNVLYLDIFPAGPQLDQLAVHLRQNPTPAFAYTIPTFHNPTGQTLSLEQRWQMVNILHRYQTLGVEDDSYGLLRFEGERLPTLFELSGGTTVYSASFSHAIAPGLRVGVFIVPEELAGPLAAQATSTYITPALLDQATVFEFIRRGALEAHLETLTAELGARCDAMIAAVARHVPGAGFVRPEGGVYLMLTLPGTVNIRQALERAEGVTALAGDDFYGRPNTVRLNFAACARDEIEPGIERLAAALALEPT